MSFFGKGWPAFILLVFLSACTEREGLAPVVELNWRAINTNQQQHTVIRGETLYAIAFRYDKDYRQLAAVNRLHSPYTLRVGQVLQLKPGVTQPTRQVPNNKPRYYSPVTPIEKRISTNNNIGWMWPVKGRVAANFAPSLGKKGIDIAGKKGQMIRAASGGVVAYAGSGLTGYGNLIIIKHNNQYLTAYGNNLRNLVKEGQTIKAGQVIAEMGVVDRRFWGVHFEIRKAGKPVNPLNYL